MFTFQIGPIGEYPCRSFIIFLNSVISCFAFISVLSCRFSAVFDRVLKYNLVVSNSRTAIKNIDKVSTYSCLSLWTFCGSVYRNRIDIAFVMSTGQEKATGDLLTFLSHQQHDCAVITEHNHVYTVHTSE